MLQSGDRGAAVGACVLDEDGVRRTVGPQQVAQTVQDATRRLVAESIKQADRAQVWKPDGPFTLEALLTTSAIGDMLAIAPGTERTSPRSVQFHTEDIRMLYRMLLTWMNLGRRVAPETPVE